MNRYRGFVAMAAASAMLLSACGGSGSGGEAEGTIKVAGLMPLTGGAAGTYGKSMIAGIEYVFDQVNADGGVEVGGKSYQLDFKVFDDEMSPEPSQAAAQLALDDDYEFVFGPIGSGAASAVQPIMARSEALWLLNPAVEGPTKLPNVFRTFPLIDVYTDVTLAWLEEHPEIEKVAMMTDQNHTGLAGATPDLVKGIEALGREVVVAEDYQTGDTDFRAPITSILAKKPDLFLQRAFPAEAALLLKQTRELGGDMDVMWNAGVTNDEARSLVGSESDLKGLHQAAPLFSLDSFLAEDDEVAVAMADKVGDKAGSFSALAHDMATTFVAALESADEPTHDGVTEALSALPASALDGKTLNDYRPQDRDLVFQDREVDVEAFVVDWSDKGWVLSE